jgi:hypothetical protein
VPELQFEKAVLKVLIFPKNFSVDENLNSQGAICEQSFDPLPLINTLMPFIFMP